MVIVLWLVGGVGGAIVFWLVQVLAGGGTIPAFVGQQIVATGGYAESLATPIGWAVHLGVGLSYAALFGVIALLLRRLPAKVGLVVTLVLALVLGWLTTLIAPPAISVMISVLGGQGWPGQLFPLNPPTELGLPFWNHAIFFVLNWLVQGLGGRLVR